MVRRSYSITLRVYRLVAVMVRVLPGVSARPNGHNPSRIYRLQVRHSPLLSLEIWSGGAGRVERGRWLTG